jgi:tetratricopeptide (TPR) repeat protein
MSVSASRSVTRALAFVLAVATVVAPARASADDRSEARAHYEKATGAYALGRYADAAAEFEQAFTLKPDPAILYNAAQAYRLAGKKERALELYRSYRRVYGRRAEHAPDVEKHVAELEKAIEADKHASSAESTGLATVDPGVPSATTAMPPPQLTAPPPPLAPAPAASATLVAKPAPPPTNEDRPIYQRWWFWAGAGAVVVGAIVGIALASRKAADCGGGVDYCANTGL